MEKDVVGAGSVQHFVGGKAGKRSGAGVPFLDSAVLVDYVHALEHRVQYIVEVGKVLNDQIARSISNKGFHAVASAMGIVPKRLAYRRQSARHLFAISTPPNGY